MSELKVGQKVWVKKIGHMRNGDTAELDQVEVAKIGKKYFEVSKVWYGRFFIETLYQDGKGYTSQYKAYLSKEKAEEELEIIQLSNKIRQKIGQYGDIRLPVEKLRNIWKELTE